MERTCSERALADHESILLQVTKAAWLSAVRCLPDTDDEGELPPDGSVLQENAHARLPLPSRTQQAHSRRTAGGQRAGSRRAAGAPVWPPVHAPDPCGRPASGVRGWARPPPETGGSGLAASSGASRGPARGVSGRREEGASGRARRTAEWLCTSRRQPRQGRSAPLCCMLHKGALPVRAGRRGSAASSSPGMRGACWPGPGLQAHLFGVVAGQPRIKLALKPIWLKLHASARRGHCKGQRTAEDCSGQLWRR